MLFSGDMSIIVLPSGGLPAGLVWPCSIPFPPHASPPAGLMLLISSSFPSSFPLFGIRGYDSCPVIQDSCRFSNALFCFSAAAPVRAHNSMFNRPLHNVSCAPAFREKQSRITAGRSEHACIAASDAVREDRAPIFPSVPRYLAQGVVEVVALRRIRDRFPRPVLSFKYTEA